MICKVCNIDKPESEMKTKTKCMCCHRNHHAEYIRNYNSKPENKEKKRIKDKEYHDKNKDNINEIRRDKTKNDPEYRKMKKESDKKYYEKVKNDPELHEKQKIRARERNREYYKDPIKRERMRKNARESGKRNRDSRNAYRRNRKKTDEAFRISENLRNYTKRMLKTLENGNNFKSEVTRELAISIFNIIGPRPSEDHHLDHIIPLSCFDLTKKEHRQLANCPENLQWLTSFENLSKNNNLDWQQILCSNSLMLIAKKINIL